MIKVGTMGEREKRKVEHMREGGREGEREGG